VRLLLIRHAAPVDDARGRCYGKLDIGLSAEGERQAEALARSLRGERLAVVVSSPARRAIETAIPLAAAQGLDVEIHDDLGELDFGELEGRTYDEIASSLPELYARWMSEPTSVRFPGGESYDDLRRRVERTVADLLDRHGDETVAVVTHGGVVRAAVAGILGLPAERIFRLAVDHASLTVVEWIGAEPVVRALNLPAAAAHLPTPDSASAQPGDGVPSVTTKEPS
jgi:alpha-ribazole phosphatase